MSAWHQAVAASLAVMCASIPAARAAPASACSSDPGSGVPGPGHDRSFWSGIAKNRFEVPAGESADALVLELSALLGSPDPQLRDDFAYSIAAAWIYRDKRVSEKVRHELLAAAVQSLVLRKDFDAAAFARFLAEVAAPGEHLWDQGPLVETARYAATQNGKDLLRSLYVALVLNKAAPEPPRAEILKTLEKLGT